MHSEKITLPVLLQGFTLELELLKDELLELTNDELIELLEDGLLELGELIVKEE